MSGQQPNAREPGYFAVSPLMLFPKAFGRFKVFIRQAGQLVLYASENEIYTREHLSRLHENDVTEVFVQTGERERFDRYLEHNLAQYLLNDRVPLEARARIFHTAARSMVRELYGKKLPAKLLKRVQFARIAAFVEKTLAFLARGESLKQLATLMAHDFKTYDHSLQVFVFATTLMNTYSLSEDEMVQIGVGAVLHDLGKLGIDAAILDKPGPLTAEETLIVRTHPAKGVALCSGLNLSLTAMQCILFHHERADGSGYPGGVGSGEIPLAAMAVGLVDVFAALTSARPYASAVSPFEALRIMRDMKGAFDTELFKRFVMVLSGAEIV
jgi:HD-GYP domain-containing protein (c-di-GMP phosphodiesterase class II)